MQTSFACGLRRITSRTKASNQQAQRHAIGRVKTRQQHYQPPPSPLPSWRASAAPCGPFQAWTKPLHPGQAWAQPLRGSGLAHPFHCKTSQPLPVDNCKQLPTAITCHHFFKKSPLPEQPNSRPFGA